MNNFESLIVLRYWGIASGILFILTLVCFGILRHIRGLPANQQTFSEAMFIVWFSFIIFGIIAHFFWERERRKILKKSRGTKNDFL